jgi:hypothetical protein
VFVEEACLTLMPDAERDVDAIDYRFAIRSVLTQERLRLR